MSLIDTFGRVHDSLRISVTDRCNIRCFYCMPDGGVTFQPRAEILSYEELERVVRVAVAHGVDKVRITGGEPLLRRDLSVLVAGLAAVPGVRDLALTTNAVLLARDAQALHDAGLRRLNIHLDTLDRARFLQMTRRDDLARVLEGIEAARSLGFSLKLNAVAVRDLNEPDILPIARFCRENGIEARFIEFMPLDGQGLWDRSKVMSADEMRHVISAGIAPLIEVPGDDPRAPATEYTYADTGARLGVIASVTKPFCLNCNRLRLTADGKLRYCLFAIEETDIKPLLRGGGSDGEIADALHLTTRQKWLGHQIDTARFVPPPRPMYSIGG